MKRMSSYQLVAILLAGLLPMVGAGLVAEWGLLFLFGLWTAVWLLLIWGEGMAETAVHIPPTYANYLFLVAALLLAYAAWLDVAAGWLMGGILFALAAWDLDAFQRRLRYATRIEEEDHFTRIHLRRLLTALVIGLGLSTAVLFIQFELRFGWGVLLVLLLILAFHQIISSLRKGVE
jgi:hypothetical protein